MKLVAAMVAAVIVSGSITNSVAAQEDWETTLAGLYLIAGDERLQEKIELSDTQAETLQEFIKEDREAYQAYREAKVKIIHEQFGQDIALSDSKSKNLAQLEDRYLKLQIQRRKELAENLLVPDQISQLPGLAWFQQTASTGSYAELLTSKMGSHFLQLDNDQIEKIHKEDQKLEIEFQKEVELLKQKYRAKLNKQLDQKQRDKVEELFSEPISLAPTPIKF